MKVAADAVNLEVPAGFVVEEHIQLKCAAGPALP